MRSSSRHMSWDLWISRHIKTCQDTSRTDWQIKLCHTAECIVLSNRWFGHRSTEPSLDFDFHKRRRAILLYHPNRLVDELGLADIKTLVRFNLKITVLHPSKSGEFFHKGWVGTCRCCKIVEPYAWHMVTRNIDRHTHTDTHTQTHTRTHTKISQSEMIWVLQVVPDSDYCIPRGAAHNSAIALLLAMGAARFS